METQRRSGEYTDAAKQHLRQQRSARTTMSATTSAVLPHAQVNPLSLRCLSPVSICVLRETSTPPMQGESLDPPRPSAVWTATPRSAAAALPVQRPPASPLQERTEGRLHTHPLQGAPWRRANTECARVEANREVSEWTRLVWYATRANVRIESEECEQHGTLRASRLFAASRQ